MSNRVKAYLTVLVGLLGILGWRLVAQQSRGPLRMPFPPLVPEQVISLEAAQVENCASAVLRVHDAPLVLETPAARETAPLNVDRAALLVRSVATAYLQRDFQTPARVSAPVMVRGNFLGNERQAWGQVWQPPGFDGTYTETNALVVYVDAVAAVPLVVYTDVALAENAPGCVFPPPPRTLADTLNTWFPFMVGVAVMLIAFGALLGLRHGSVVAVSE